MQKTKTIKAQTPASLRAKIEAAKAEGWQMCGEIHRYNGKLCVLMIRAEQQ